MIAKLLLFAASIMLVAPQAFPPPPTSPGLPNTVLTFLKTIGDQYGSRISSIYERWLYVFRRLQKSGVRDWNNDGDHDGRRHSDYDVNGARGYDDRIDGDVDDELIGERDLSAGDQRRKGQAEEWIAPADPESIGEGQPELPREPEAPENRVGGTHEDAAGETAWFKRVKRVRDEDRQRAKRAEESAEDPEGDRPVGQEGKLDDVGQREKRENAAAWKEALGRQLTKLRQL